MDKDALKAVEVIFTDHVDGKYRFNSAGSVEPIGRRKDYKTHLTGIYVAEFAPKFPSYTPAQFFDELEKLLPAYTPAAGCVDLDASVQEFINEMDLRISADGKTITWGAYVDVAPSDLRETLKAWCYKRNLTLGKDDVKYSADAMFAGFCSMTQARNVQVWDDLRTELAYDKTKGAKLPDLLTTVLRAIRVDETNVYKFSADKIMLAHWMWTVKRRLCKLDYSPAFPLMVVFRGRQGGGKTSFVQNHLCSVFAGKVVCPDLSVIHDSREFKKWTENIVVSFDELSMRGLHDSKRNRTPELIKQLLTASLSQERTFHTQAQQTYRIRASFCATTNKALAESISDPTGMRRFWEIQCGTTDKMPEFDWKTIESFDWLALWQAIDENRTDGYLKPSNKKTWEFVEKTQDTYCVSPSLRTWFEDKYEPYWKAGLTKLTGTGIAKDATLTAEGVRAHSLLHLYGEYADLMQELNNYPVSQTHFAQCLHKLGVRTVPRSRTRMGTDYYVVKETK